MTFTFAPATREQSKARIALAGPPGSGKTFTGLTLLSEMTDRIAVIDTERGSASKYAAGAHGGFNFDVLQLTTFDPRDLPKALAAAAAAGYGGVMVDSLSHFWSGAGGMLELVDAMGKRSGAGGGFGGWKDARPFERAMIDALVAYPGHVIVTMRTKVEWLIDDSSGKKKITKVGTKAEQREGIEYEFDIVGDLDQENTLVVSKSRCPALAGRVINRPGAPVAVDVMEWLNDGVEMADPATYLDRAVSETATTDTLLALHTEVTRRQMIGAAVLHPTTGTPTTLGAVIVERGQALRAAAQRPAPSASTQAEHTEPVDTRTYKAEDDGDIQPSVEPQQNVEPERPSAPQMRKLQAAFKELDVFDRYRRLTITSAIVGRAVPSANNLTKSEAGQLLDVLAKVQNADDPRAALAVYEPETAAA